eukprot:CAMPEP_0172530796 /NCGR_PEP_ID=MMETSP1067-20121228/4419_1 /TAXON_ID=265564 ORGANISM="Thalassiosira punctigera, Strain Tpunct2005C2" /NCGR_SAMPLE_ID=MMETSP1067 /ASSEMBLY_ACC=CAM_ASM_000444 /LENGTH=608 /DNA_ID=CAMNT_0013315067 /DNA_START=178 /DNA_END=2004 /DNA_ORIENTATION=+
MKLSSSLTVALASCHHLSGVHGGYYRRHLANPGSVSSGAAAGVHALHRMLASKEDGARGTPSSDERMLQKKGGNSGGGQPGGGGAGGAPGKSGGGSTGKKAGGGGSTGKNTGGGGGGGSSTKTKGGNTRKKGSEGNNKGKFGVQKFHSAHLDANDSGMTTDFVEYKYGDPIVVKIDATVLTAADPATIDDWKLGIFMRMADPQDGSVEPIASVPAGVTVVKRRLQDGDGKDDGATDPTAIPVVYMNDDKDGGATDPTEVPIGTEDEEDREPVELTLVGGNTFTADLTSAKVLDENEYGIGFDVIIIDGEGSKIHGAATFYMEKTQAMLDAEAAEEKAGKTYGLAKHDHGKKKPGKKGASTAKGGSTGKGGATVSGKGAGFGTGADGGMIISTTESLAEYVLDTDKETYDIGDTVIVEYDLAPGSADARRRRRLPRAGRIAGGSDGSGVSKGKGKVTTTSTAAPPVDEDTTTTEAPLPDTMTSDDTNSTDTMTSDDMGSTEIGGVPADFVDLSFQEEIEIDENDVTLFVMNVYMRMAHPQGGKLAPILSVPFCAEGEDCAAEELNAGEISFSTNDLKYPKITGYDIWILNGKGGEVAGMKTFYISIDEE